MQVEEACQQFGLLPSDRNITNISLEKFSFIPQYNLLYCRIPKAGTTSWVVGTIGEMARKVGLKMKSRPQIREHFEVKNIDMLNRILEGDPVSFANVRHPFERLVSAYVDKGHRYSWEEFLKIVLMEAKAIPDMNFTKMNIHWRPYNSICSFCILKYKIISKMETFAEDRERIWSMVGFEGEKDELKLNVHGGDQACELTKRYFKNIPKEVKNELLDLYRYEFALFGYDKDLY